MKPNTKSIRVLIGAVMLAGGVIATANADTGNNRQALAEYIYEGCKETWGGVIPNIVAFCACSAGNLVGGLSDRDVEIFLYGADGKVTDSELNAKFGEKDVNDAVENVDSLLEYETCEFLTEEAGSS